MPNTFNQTEHEDMLRNAAWLNQPQPQQVYAVPPITHGGVDRGWKLCLCSVCGLVSECTPSQDFYTTDSPTGLLKCEACYWDYARTRMRETGHGDKVETLDAKLAERGGVK